MALIKHAQAATIARQAVVLDLGDLQRQGAVLVQQAREQAARIVEDAGRERERITAGAADEGRSAGFERGLAEGRASGRDEGRAAALLEHQASLQRIEQAWIQALSEFCEARDRLVTGAARDVLRLAAAVAEKVTKRSVELDPSVAIDQLEAVLAAVVRPTALCVRIHPGDRPIVEAALPGLVARFHAVRHADLVDDPSLDRGSCIAACRDPSGAGGVGGEIDASIGTQIGRIIAAILPDADDGPKAARDGEPRP